jgi:hypothetical protein
VPVWGLRLPRPHGARLGATARLSRLMPVPGVPPRVSSIPVPGALRRGVAVVPTFWVIQRVSCSIG